MRTFTQGVDRWKYKSLAEIEALSDLDLVRAYADLRMAIKAFHDARMPMTDEMFWLLMVLPGEIEARLKMKGDFKGMVELRRK